MADLETGLNIPVSAFADKDSAKEAVNDLTKGVLNSLKNGYIEVPAEIKASFARGSKELDKAQKDVINQWEKMSKEGFSSSEEYLDDLINKYKKFKSLAGKEGKGNSRQTKWLTKNIGESLQPYLAQKRELEKIIASSKTVKKAPTKKITHSYDEVRDNKLKGIKQVGPKGYKSNSGVDAGRTNNYEFRMSESSPYKSIGSYIAEKNRREEEKKSAASLKTWKDENYKPKQGGGRATTDKENAEINASKSLTELKKLIVAIEKGVEGITPEQVQTQLGIVKDLFQKNGKDLEETSIAIKNAIEKPYSDNANRRLGSTSGEEKGVGPGHETAKSTQKMIYDIWTKLIEATDPAVVYMKRFAKEMLEANTTLKKATSGMKKTINENSFYSKTKTESSNSDSVKQIQALGATLKGGLDATKTAIVSNKTATDKQTQYDIIEHSAERVADSAEAQKNRQLIDKNTELTDIEKTDSETGFNTNANATQVINGLEEFQSIKDVLNSILSVLQNGININPKAKPSISGNDMKAAQESLKRVLQPNSLLRLPPGNPQLALPEAQGKFSRSEVTTSLKDPAKWYIRLKDSLADLVGVTAKYKKVIAATSDAQDKMAADRIKQYGFDRGRGGESDKISIARRLSLFRDKDGFKTLFPNLKLSEGIKIDTTEVTDKLSKILSGKSMRNAQMGGSPLRQIIGYSTGFIGMPSVEKSRAAADALNQINENIRTAMNETLNIIQDKESALQGMLNSGDLKLGADGTVLESSTTEAKTLAAELENSKLILDSILADMGMVNTSIGKAHGNISKTFKYLSFTSPKLRENNSIINNINAGYNKSGKALKFQTRLAEILNYSFRLMGRHIGQIFKNLILMANPINLIKRAFSDFASYDVKWQRTMNVIKYNLRRIIRPFMEWLGQQLVNILGVINAIIKGIGQAFGKDWDLFDQSAASAEQMREELEAASNVTASFDELHDIGTESSNNPAMDLMGDIYTPQWGDLYETITGKAKALTEFLIPIFETLGKVIKWCLDNWKLLVGAFVAFKIAQGLWNLWKFFGGLGDLMGGLPGIFMKAMSAIAGTALIVLSQLGTVKLAKEWDQMSKSDRWKKAGINIGEGIAGGALIGFAIGGPMGAAIGAGIGGLVTGFEQLTIAAYNGSEAATVAAGALGGAGLGAAIGSLFGPLGTLAGAAIGAVVGSLGGLIVNVGRCKGEFNKLKISAEDLAWAQQQTAEATNTYYTQLAQLEQIEAQTGLSGEALYESVQNGTLAVDQMTSSQYAVYQAYLNTKDALEQLQKAQKTELDYSARMALDADKQSGNFENYISTMQKGMERGIVSHEDMVDNFAQGYAELSKDQRKVFLEELPPYMRKSVEAQSKEYISGWERFKTNAGNLFSDIGKRISGEFKTLGNSIADGWKSEGLTGAIKGFFGGLDKSTAKSINELYNLKATEDDLKASTEALAQAQADQNLIQAQVDMLQQRTGISASELYEQLMNGTRVYTMLSDDEKALIDSYTELQEAMQTTDTVALEHAKTLASIDLQAAQTSGNYDTFINNLIAANERGEIDTQEMQHLMSEAYAGLDYDARKTFLEKIPENMRQGVEEGAKQYEGRFQKMGLWLSGKWDEIKQTAAQKWEDIKNSAIGRKVQETWENTKTKFEDLKNTVSRSWETLKTNASTAWENIKNSIVDNAKRAWEGAKGFFDKIGEGIRNAWDGIKDFGQSAWNWVQGDGWHPNSYAVGTNYVPNDQLAMIHKGEAIIPAKYNKPYTPNNSGLENSINALTQQVLQISEQVNQGINVHGQFVQKGSDLVATVQKANNKLSNNILNNKVYAR